MEAPIPLYFDQYMLPEEEINMMSLRNALIDFSQIAINKEQREVNQTASHFTPYQPLNKDKQLEEDRYHHFNPPELKLALN